MSDSIVSFGMAMCAHEQGKTVQYFDEAWSDYGDTCVYSVYLCNRLKWRIKPEPVRYSVDVWLSNHPVFNPKMCGLSTVLFGDAHYCFERIEQNEHCNKHYKLTIESVEE